MNQQLSVVSDQPLISDEIFFQVLLGYKFFPFVSEERAGGGSDSKIIYYAPLRKKSKLTPNRANEVLGL